MEHLFLLSSATPLAMGGIVHEIIYVVGVIGCIIILLFLLLCLTMIPDFFRYLKIRNM